METLDYTILVVYLSAIVMMGLYFQRKASAGIDAYFLGNRELPWWALGASGMTSNMDVSGTMINTAFIFALGTAGFFIEIRGGVTLGLAFLMIFQGKWNRRSLVMTLAEWMHLRFGTGKQGDYARIIAAVQAIVMTIAMTTYFAIGSGIFLTELMGIQPFWGFSGEFWAALLMIVLAMIYTVASGLYGVIWTDVFQGFLIFGVVVYICVLAVTTSPLPDTFQVSVPLRDGGFLAIDTTKEAWTSLWPGWTLDFPETSTYSIYNLFGIAIFFYLLKTTLEGVGGTGNYMLQRYFAAKDDREAGLLTLFWVFLLSFRWPFIAAIATMGIVFGAKNGVIQDPEAVLPIVISELVPTGIKGLMVAGLMAAAMSTFDSTVNAGAAYWVKDIYQSYLNPKATEKQLMRHSRWASILIVAVGLAFMLFIQNINEIWGWITLSLGAGLLIPLLVRWYWWRMNGTGFAVGTLFGMVAAILQKIFFPDIPEYFAFLAASIASLIGVIAGTYMAPPTDMETLENFYRKTRPFGFWRPVTDKLNVNTMQAIRTENNRDRIATAIAVPWQLSFFLVGMAFIFQRWDQVWMLLVVFILLSIGLYHFWYKHLSTEVKVED